MISPSIIGPLVVLRFPVTILLTAGVGTAVLKGTHLLAGILRCKKIWLHSLGMLK